MHLPLRFAKQKIKSIIEVSNPFVLQMDNSNMTYDYEKLLQEILHEVGGFSIEITRIDNLLFRMVKIVKQEIQSRSI